jgi:hypothetical protein
MTVRWVVLYEGQVWQAKILQAQLDGYGIPNYVPEPFLQTPNPFVIGGTPSPETGVLVPAECEEEARALLEHSADMPAEHEPDETRTP